MLKDIFDICSVCQEEEIYSFLNVNSPQKMMSKIIENLPFCIQDIFITWT